MQLKNLLYRKLHSQGIGCSVRKTEVLSNDNEEKLCISGVLNPDTPQGLLNCVFFLNGINFCLRGGIEQRELKLSQLVREVVNVDGKLLVRYTYTEHGSKNQSGGLKQLRLENRVVHQYKSTDIQRCHVLRLTNTYQKCHRTPKKRKISI